MDHVAGGGGGVGGGGGRVAVYYKKTEFTGRQRAYGGASGVAGGGPGTVLETFIGANRNATYLYVDAGQPYKVQVRMDLIC